MRPTSGVDDTVFFFFFFWDYKLNGVYLAMILNIIMHTKKKKKKAATSRLYHDFLFELSGNARIWVDKTSSTTRSCRTASRLSEYIDATRVAVAPFELKIRSLSNTNLKQNKKKKSRYCNDHKKKKTVSP